MAPKSSTTSRPRPMRRSPGRGWGLAAVGTGGHDRLEARALGAQSAHRRCRARGANSRSVGPSASSGGTSARAASAMAAAASMRATSPASLHPRRPRPGPRWGPARRRGTTPRRSGAGGPSDRRASRPMRRTAPAAAASDRAARSTVDARSRRVDARRPPAGRGACSS